MIQLKKNDMKNHTKNLTDTFEYIGTTEDTRNQKVKVHLSPEKIDTINGICSQFDNNPGELIHILHEAQHTFGYLPAELQDVVARNLNIPVSQVYGVVTFYHYFSMVPKGEYPISACIGTACYVRGAERVLEELKKELGIEVGETTPDGKFSLNCLRCVGACGLSPVIMVGEKVYGRVSPDGVKEIIAEYRNK